MNTSSLSEYSAQKIANCHPGRRVLETLWTGDQANISRAATIALEQLQAFRASQPPDADPRGFYDHQTIAHFAHLTTPEKNCLKKCFLENLGLEAPNEQLSAYLEKKHVAQLSRLCENLQKGEFPCKEEAIRKKTEKAIRLKERQKVIPGLIEAEFQKIATIIKNEPFSRPTQKESTFLANLPGNFNAELAKLKSDYPVLKKEGKLRHIYLFINPPGLSSDDKIGIEGFIKEYQDSIDTLARRDPRVTEAYSKIDKLVDERCEVHNQLNVRCENMEKYLPNDTLDTVSGSLSAGTKSAKHKPRRSLTSRIRNFVSRFFAAIGRLFRNLVGLFKR